MSLKSRRILKILAGFALGVMLMAAGFAIAAIVFRTTATNQFATADYFGDINIGNADSVPVWNPAAVDALEDATFIVGCLVVSADSSSTGPEEVRLYATALAGDTGVFELSGNVKTSGTFIGLEGAYQEPCGPALGTVYGAAPASTPLIAPDTLVSDLPTTYGAGIVIGSSDGTDDAWALQLTAVAAPGAPASSWADVGFVFERQNPAP